MHGGVLSSRVKQLMDYNKSKHRTHMLLPEWSKDDYWRKQDEVLRADTFEDTIERIHIDKITTEDFIEKFERGSKPVII